MPLSAEKLRLFGVQCEESRETRALFTGTLDNVLDNTLDTLARPNPNDLQQRTR